MKTRLQIILHCLPREIDEVERICNHLQRSSHLLSEDDEVILDFTLNISDKLTIRKINQEIIRNLRKLRIYFRRFSILIQVNI